MLCSAAVDNQNRAWAVCIVLWLCGCLQAGHLRQMSAHMNRSGPEDVPRDRVMVLGLCFGLSGKLLVRIL